MVGRVRPGGVEEEKEVRVVSMSQRDEWDVYLFVGLMFVWLSPDDCRGLTRG